MTQLTDKMDGLRLKQGEAVPFQAIHFNEAIDKCIALVNAEEAVVGDWEAELEKHAVYAQGLEGKAIQVKKVKAIITSLLAAKDREIAEAAATEYRQFILNVLDGIDIADGECNTKAIRLAIASRII